MPQSPGVLSCDSGLLWDLPAQLQELYQQGFSLATSNPFVQPTHKQGKMPLEHIFRAMLNEGHVLELDCSSSFEQLTDCKTIPAFVKKVQEAVSQGLKFLCDMPQHHCPAILVGSSSWYLLSTVLKTNKKMHVEITHRWRMRAQGM